MNRETVVERNAFNSYLRYIRRLGAVCLATEKLDRRIRQLQVHLKDSTIGKKDVDACIEPEIENAWKLLEKINPLDKDVRIGDYYRLKSHANLASEMILAPYVFASGDIEARQELADGTTGIATEIVEDTMHIHYGTKEHDDRIRSQTCGIINEYSAIGLVNLPEDGQQIILPSSQYDDMFNKVDAVYYGTASSHQEVVHSGFREKHGKYFRTFVQVKSNRRPAHASVRSRQSARSDKAAYIYASDFGNHRRYDNEFDTSRLLLSEMNGVEQVANQSEELSRQSQSITHHIRAQRNKSNTKYLD